MTKYKIILPLVGFVALMGAANVEGQSGKSPAPAAPAAPDKAIIEVEGDKSEALKILRSQGVNAVELKGSSYTLPTVAVDAPDVVDYGEMVVVSAVIDKTKFPDGLQKINYQWTVLEGGQVKTNAVVWPDGTRVFFAAGMKPKTFQVLLDVDCLFGTPTTSGSTTTLTNAEMDSPPIAVKTIVVGGPTPIPDPVVPPQPTPTPTPPVPTPTPTPAPVTPTFPAGKYGLSDFTYKAVQASTLTQAEKVAFASNMAKAFDATAAKIAAIQDFRDPTKILQDLKDGNNAALAASGVDPAKLTGLKASLSDKLYNLAAANQIATADDYGTAFREISEGLKAVK
jgi:hypothetical protein